MKFEHKQISSFDYFMTSRVVFEIHNLGNKLGKSMHGQFFFYSLL